eukprot:1161013-Pelagomonas_calceolata.AAC.13
MRSVRSASPAYLPRQSAPLRTNRATGCGALRAHSPAKARTAAVLPLPGTPCSSTPLHAHSIAVHFLDASTPASTVHNRAQIRSAAANRDSSTNSKQRIPSLAPAC